ncbi:hypothetical protein HNP84_005718 [Thermocatellispora tengchongensis]|uniref:Uncharacterized protein n=1 Tax=Thermocatellispora tengchongensis TaxID=1073253 RepID=A0A840P3U9_9ACTN|nr:hypothetical protein [Thermocatellispora tengchongensis]
MAAESSRYIFRRLFLNLRLATRAACVVTALALGVLPPAAALAAGALCCGYDVLLYALMRPGSRRPLPARLRLALDCADVAAWSLALGQPSDSPPCWPRRWRPRPRPPGGAGRWPCRWRWGPRRPPRCCWPGAR